jgi:hypothetical protein
MEKIRIRDQGWKKVGSGIRDKHPGSATLITGTSAMVSLIITISDVNDIENNPISDLA